MDPLAFSGLVLTQVGYNAGTRPKIEIGDGAIVIGDGLVGQWSAQTLAWRGAQVLLVGRHPDRLEKFANAPYCHVVNAHEEDWVAKAKALFPSGAQAAVDTVGSIEVMEQFQQVVRRCGHLGASAGFYGTQDAMALQPPRYGEHLGRSGVGLAAAAHGRNAASDRSGPAANATAHYASLSRGSGGRCLGAD